MPGEQGPPTGPKQATAVGQGHSRRQAKRPRESGQLGYTRAAREGI
jgi:hypothetical protein